MPDLLPSGWRFARLDQLGTVERGRSRNRPRNSPHLYGGLYPFVQTGDVKAAGLRLYTYSQTYSEAGLAQSRLWPAGTLCITIAANICDTTILGIAACFPDSIVGFTADENVADVVFVKYALDLAKRRFTDISRGATQDNLSVEKMLSQSLPIPTLAIQRRIASILGAYDKLIEVNRRRIAVLEEMARRLFDEWFVHFRFPGHEGPELIATRGGLLPEGWQVVELGSAAYLRMGQSPPSETYNENEVGLPFHQGVSDFGRHFPTDRVFTTSVDTDRVAEEGDVLFSVRAPVGRINVTLSKIVLGRGVSGIRGKETHFFILEALRQRFQATDQIGNGTIFKSVTKRDISSIPLIWPTALLRQRFDTISKGIWGKLRVLSLTNRRLVASRDLLLPRLISGSLTVTAAEAELERAA